MNMIKMGYRFNESKKIISMSIDEANQDNLKVYTLTLSELQNHIKELSNNEIQLIVGDGGYGKWKIEITNDKYKDYTINEIVHEFYFEKRKDILIVHIAIDVTTDYVLISYKETSYFRNLEYNKPRYPYLVLYSDGDDYNFEKFKTEEQMMEFIIRCDKAKYDIFDIIRIRSSNDFNDYNMVNKLINENKGIDIKIILMNLAIDGIYVSDELLQYINYKLEEN